jgi:Xaa-Pro aminopeptidase
LAEIGTPGTEAKVLYNEAVRIATEAGLDEFFMGHNHHASFIGHGVGIQINEWPVLAPRSKHVLAEGNVIAIEPKFVIPGVGAVGIENTYVCTAKGLRCLTPAPENIIPLI